MPTLGVFAAIIDEDDRILCVRMNYATRAWTTPGGRMEPGESPLDAVKREVLEETGLDVVADELVGVYSKPYKDDIVLFFRARVVGHNPWEPNDEIAQIGYFCRGELPEPMGLGARIRVIDALDGTKGIVRVIPETAS
jgi:8-oxo-dGTP diphosphatase